MGRFSSGRWLKLSLFAVLALAGTAAIGTTGASALSFQPAAGNPVGGYENTNDVASGDFNGDGFDDLAMVVQGGSTPGLYVWLSDTDGTFTEAAGSPLSTNSAGNVLAADLNGDDEIDLLAGNSSMKTWLGVGDGSFTSGTTVSMDVYPGSSTSIRLARVNADSYLDLVTAGYPHAYQVALGVGDGSFASPLPAGTVASAGANSFESLTVGDFDGDGFADLAFANYPNPFDPEDPQYWGAYVVSGDGTGSFTDVPQNPFLMDNEAFPKSLAAGRLRPGAADDLVATTLSEDIQTLRSDPTDFLALDSLGTFQTGSFPIEAAVTDMNSDGDNDVVTANFGGASISVGLGDGLGGLSRDAGSPWSLEDPAYYPSSLTIGDFNGDGYPDTAMSSGSSNPATVRGIGVMLSSPGLAFDPGSADFGPVGVGDDGTLDIEVESSGGPDATIDSISLTGDNADQFSIEDGVDSCETGLLPSGESCTVSLAASPTSTGPKQASVEIAIDGIADPVVLPLTVEGVQPEGTISPTFADFGKAVIGGVSPAPSRTFEIESTGTSPLVVDGASITGADASSFTTDATACDGELAPESTCSLSVTFDPKSGAPGAREATLEVGSNSAGQPLSVVLNGAAVTKPRLSVKLKAGKARRGKMLKVKVKVRNSGKVAVNAVRLRINVSGPSAKRKAKVTIGSIAPGKTTAFPLKVKVSRKARRGSRFKFVVSAAADDARPGKSSARVRVAR